MAPSHRIPDPEDPQRRFMPLDTRRLVALPSAPGVRVDTLAYAGYRISPSYDSLLAKVIAVSKEPRLEAAVRKLGRALDEAHALVVERLERRREDAPLGEADRIGTVVIPIMHER